MTKRFYIRKEIVPFEEDFQHDFKGHRNLSVDNLPPWTQETKTDKASRRAVSRTLNAFLNTGKGGTVYLGILDSGEVMGLPLTDSQKEHVLCNLEDLFSRYNPPVKRHRYKVKFVPVVENRTEGESHPHDKPLMESPEKKSHEVRSHKFCWCDREAVMMFNSGIMVSDYVIEIKIQAWDPEDPKCKEEGYGSVIKIHPIHEDEERRCYFRRQASLRQYSINELAQLTRHEVQEACRQKIASLKREVASLQKTKELADS